MFQRTALADTELGGQRIKQGQRVGLFYRSANFDEDVFDHPERFDILRDPNPHVGLGGFGAHYCLGASLAKLEIGLIFNAIADAMPDIRPAGQPERLRSGWLNGIKHLPVSYTGSLSGTDAFRASVRCSAGYSRQMDWSLFGCARKGHVTYAPSEPELRERLMAPTPAGQAWRCLRCGAYATDGQHGSGPAAEAPLVRRGKELRSELLLRIFAVERFLRFLVLGAPPTAMAVPVRPAGVQRAFNDALPAIRDLYGAGFDIAHSKLLGFIQHSFTLNPACCCIAIGLAVYAVIELVEPSGCGGSRWGEYFAMVATSVFLPYEITTSR